MRVSQAGVQWGPLGLLGLRAQDREGQGLVILAEEQQMQKPGGASGSFGRVWAPWGRKG